MQDEITQDIYIGMVMSIKQNSSTDMSLVSLVISRYVRFGFDILSFSIPLDRAILDAFFVDILLYIISIFSKNMLLTIFAFKEFDCILSEKFVTLFIL